MKESDYNLYTQIRGKTLYFNTLSGSFVFMPPRLHTLVRSGAFGEMSEQELQTLTENHLLVDDDENERQGLIKEYEETVSEDSALYQLTLLPSLDCNLRCWYCFETHVTGSRLDRQTQDAIFNHAEQVARRENIKYIQVELFGGEPLLYFEEELYPLLSRIKTCVEGLEKYVSFFFVTNGVCIAEEMIPLFADLKASFQISIDGYREKHNKVKKIPHSDEDVYARIMRTIHLLTGAYETYINLRINYDNQTLHHIEEVVKDVLDVDPRRLGIHLERVWQTNLAERQTGYDMNRILAFIMANGFTVSYTNLHRKAVSCKASNRNQSVISWNGDVYKCSGRNFTPAHREGKLLPDGSIAWETEKLQKRLDILTYDNEDCLKCKLLPLCCGPCCQKQLDTPGEIRRYCQERLMEISLDDFLVYRFTNERIRRSIYETEHV
jgi:uncharacterized protein